MTAAADRAAERASASMVGFNYRRVPALALARQLVARRPLGTLRHVRAEYLQDWLVDPEFPLVLAPAEGPRGLRRARRHRRAHRRPRVLPHRRAADRRLGHARDVRQGAPAARRRPRASAATAAPRRARSRSTTPRSFTGAFDGGATGVVRGDPVRDRTQERACGSRSTARRGSLAFDFEGMNELHFYDAHRPPQTAGLPPHPGHRARPPLRRAWWPPGHLLGYEHSFTHQVVDFVTAIAERRPPRRRSPTASRCSGCSTRSSGRRPGIAWTPIAT